MNWASWRRTAPRRLGQGSRRPGAKDSRRPASSRARSKAGYSVSLRASLFWSCKRRHGAAGGRNTSGSADPFADHVLGNDHLVILLLADFSRPQRGLFEGRTVGGGLLGDVRGILVADHRRQRGHQHQRVPDVAVDLVAIELRALDRVGPEFLAAVAQDRTRI